MGGIFINYVLFYVKNNYSSVFFALMYSLVCVFWCFGISKKQCICVKRYEPISGYGDFLRRKLLSLVMSTEDSTNFSRILSRPQCHINWLIPPLKKCSSINQCNPFARMHHHCWSFLYFRRILLFECPHVCPHVTDDTYSWMIRDSRILGCCVVLSLPLPRVLKNMLCGVDYY